MIRTATSFARRCQRLALAVFLAGCTSNFEQGYEGNPRSPAEVATVAKPENDLSCSYVEIAGTDQISPIRAHEVTVLPGARKVYLMRHKDRSASMGDIFTAFFAFVEAVACSDVPDDQCIEFAFQAREGARYTIVANGFQDYILKNENTGQIVGAGRIVGEQKIQKKYGLNWLEAIDCPPLPYKDKT